MSKQQGIVKVRHLNEMVRQQAETLAIACRQVESIELSIYLEEPRLGQEETNQIFYYQDDQPVGVVCLSTGSSLEIMSMVHPAYRRQGIGQALLKAAFAEADHRNIQKCLLICEGASRSGLAFSEAVGGTYQFAEYQMVLDRDAFARSQPVKNTITFQQATQDDLETLVSLRIASTQGDDQNEEAVRQMTQNYLQRTDQRYFIGSVNGQPIGMLRAEEDGQNVGIYAFVVLPEYRGQGLGRQILRKMLDRLVSEDWHKIQLWVETENRNALGLYERCGFRETTTYRYYEVSGG
ncbi:MAG: GNAT family N-acetyltransferase [Chloroflexota bacterium]